MRLDYCFATVLFRFDRLQAVRYSTPLLRLTTADQVKRQVRQWSRKTTDIACAQLPVFRTLETSICRHLSDSEALHELLPLKFRRWIPDTYSSVKRPIYEHLQVKFHGTGPCQVPGVVVMELLSADAPDDASGLVYDPRFKRLLVVINALPDDAHEVAYPQVNA